jgi:hypothetical protein
MELILHCFIEGSIPILLRTIESNLCHGAFSSVFHSSRRLQGKNKAPQVIRGRALGAGAYRNYDRARAVLLVQLRRFLRQVTSKPPITWFQLKDKRKRTYLGCSYFQLLKQYHVTILKPRKKLLYCDV